MQDVESKIVNRVRGKGRGWAFTATEFADFGGASAIWTALHRLTRRGVIRRLGQGLYDYPLTHTELGVLSPSPDSIARALARSRGIRIQPSGAYAANLLGLSEQVPARIVFLTDGASRRIRFNNQEIVLRRTTPRNMITAGRISGNVIQALRHIGKSRVTSAHLQTLKKILSASEKKQVMKDRFLAPGWMRPLLEDLGTEESSNV